MGWSVVKQPDVFSQARLTRFRNDFDNQMSSDLGQLPPGTGCADQPARRRDHDLDDRPLRCARRTGHDHRSRSRPPRRSWASALEQSVPHRRPSRLRLSIRPRSPPRQPALPPTHGQGTSAATAAALGLGVDPTVYLDEKKRFLEHLNQIRRISLGPDQNDSSGYGLYLVRLPVSITAGRMHLPGPWRRTGGDRRTRVHPRLPSHDVPEPGDQRHGRRARSVHLRNDPLGLLREVSRSRCTRPGPRRRALTIQSRKRTRPAHERAGPGSDQRGPRAGPCVPCSVPPGKSSKPAHPSTNPLDPIAQPLEEFILRQIKPLTGDPANDLQVQHTLASRLTVLADALMKVKTGIPAIDAEVPAR